MRRRILITLVPLLALAWFVPPAPAQITAGFLVGVVTRVRNNKRRHKRRRRERKRKEIQDKVEASIERLKSPFPDQRKQGSAELLEMAEAHEAGEITLDGVERLGVLLEQTLRDTTWKTRHNSWQALVALDLREVPDEPTEEYAAVFGASMHQPFPQKPIGLAATPAEAARVGEGPALAALEQAADGTEIAADVEALEQAVQATTKATQAKKGEGRAAVIVASVEPPPESIAPPLYRDPAPATH